MSGRGPPAYNNAQPSGGDVTPVERPGSGPVHRAVAMDGPVAIADGQPGGWQPSPAADAARRRDVNGPVASPHARPPPGFHAPVAHRQMSNAVSPSNGLMAHRGFVT